MNDEVFLKRKVSQGQYLVVHIVDAAADDVSYAVYYNAADPVTTCRPITGAIIRNGKPLILSVQNTPLVLELPGTYTLEKRTQTESAVEFEVFTMTGGIIGDVTRQDN